MRNRYRGAIGRRRHRATFLQHDGTQDGHGNPTYTTAGDWDTLIASWPCELLTTTGGEVLRGKQVSAQTTHVLFGEYQGSSGITTSMKVTINNVEYGIVAVYDMDGDSKETRVECRREV